MRNGEGLRLQGSGTPEVTELCGRFLFCLPAFFTVAGKVRGDVSLVHLEFPEVDCVL